LYQKKEKDPSPSGKKGGDGPGLTGGLKRGKAAKELGGRVPKKGGRKNLHKQHGEKRSKPRDTPKKNHREI